MKKTVLIGLFIAAIGGAMIASLGTSNLAFAQASNSQFGQEASQLAKCQTNCLGEPNTNKGGMGQHTSSSVSGGSGPEGQRVGIGNVGEDILGSSEKLTPSEVIRQLCGPTGGGCP
jgi:hypothetical protein